MKTWPRCWVLVSLIIGRLKTKKEGYLTYNESIIGDLSNVDDEDAILLVNDDLERQYFCVEKILMGYDRYYQLFF